MGVTNATELWGTIRKFVTNASGVVVETPPSTGFDDLWHHTAVSIYDNQMDAASCTNAERVNTITHEMGHTLKLAHVRAGTYRVQALPSGSRSIMEADTRQSFAPQQYDKNELIYKWGV